MKKLSLIALILVCALLTLTACSPVESVKKTLEKDGYTVKVYEEEDQKKFDGEVSAALTATKTGKVITVVWFVNEDDAKNYESVAKGGGIGELIGSWGGAEVYRDGKMVAAGSKEAVELIK